MWAFSSAGRADGWQSSGRRFNPCKVHQIFPPKMLRTVLADVISALPKCTAVELAFLGGRFARVFGYGIGELRTGSGSGRLGRGCWRSLCFRFCDFLVES